MREFLGEIGLGHVLLEFDLLQVQIEHFLPLNQGGHVDADVAVEATRTEKGLQIDEF